MDFPRFSYSPLRPQTTIAIDHVKIASNETQPSVKIIAIFCANLQNDFNLYHTGNPHQDICGCRRFCTKSHYVVELWESNPPKDSWSFIAHPRLGRAALAALTG